jgi:hypothetical protein
MTDQQDGTLATLILSVRSLNDDSCHFLAEVRAWFPSESQMHLRREAFGGNPFHQLELEKLDPFSSSNTQYYIDNVEIEDYSSGASVKDSRIHVVDLGTSIEYPNKLVYLKENN